MFHQENIENLINYKKCQNKKLICNNKIISKKIKKTSISLEDFIYKTFFHVLFFISGKNINIKVKPPRQFDVIVPIASSTSKIFSDEPFNYIVNLKSIKIFKDFINSTLEPDSNIEEDRYFKYIYDKNNPFIEKQPNCSLEFFNSNNDSFNNVSKLINVKSGNNDTIILTFEIPHSSNYPEHNKVYNSFSCTVDDDSFTVTSPAGVSVVGTSSIIGGGLGVLKGAKLGIKGLKIQEGLYKDMSVDLKQTSDLNDALMNTVENLRDERFITEEEKLNGKIGFTKSELENFADEASSQLDASENSEILDNTINTTVDENGFIENNSLRDIISNREWGKVTDKTLENLNDYKENFLEGSQEASEQAKNVLNPVDEFGGETTSAGFDIGEAAEATGISGELATSGEEVAVGCSAGPEGCIAGALVGVGTIALTAVGLSSVASGISSAATSFADWF